MNIHTIKQKIINYMNQTMLASVSYMQGSKIRSKMMIFGNDKKGIIYLCAKNETQILQAIQKNPQVSLLISREEEILDDICALSISATATIVDPADSQANLLAYDILGKKSPILGNIPYTSESNSYTIIKISAEEFNFQQYNNYKNSKKAFILKKR